jgi:hypothetical protein
MDINMNNLKLPKLIFIGFVAGFLATVIFHQGFLEILAQLNMIPFKPYNITPTHPFGVPSFISLSFWGGIWGILGILIFKKYLNKKRFWIFFAIFGGIFPPLIYCLIVMPAKDIDPTTILQPARLTLMFVVNFIWGFGTALFSRVLLKILSKN